MGEGCIQTEDGARPGDANDHLAVLGSSGREFQIPTADEVKAPRILALAEEGCLGWEADGAGNEFQIGQDRASKGTKPSRSTV